MERRSGGGYSYWKRPGLRWLLPAAAGLQLLSLWMRVGDLRETAGVADRLMSSALWEEYLAQESFQCAISSLLAGLFLGAWLLGFFVKSRRQADLGTGILCLALAAGWGLAGAAWPPVREGGGAFWPLLLLLLLGFGAYCVIRYRFPSEEKV